MSKIELLAPAKDLKTAIAAINSGCDALYIGATSFGARQNASNSLRDIKQVVEYAHKFNVKVHITINTILTDDELNSAKDLIKELYKIGVDALIIQDMGLLKSFIDNELPSIPVHISTQANNRTLDKAKFFDKIGVSRVILARELSIKQIEEICKNTSCEIETFIHGALCVSYSGQCYMSCANGGRSANRGECAQSCRQKYTLIDENGNVIAKDKYLLSLKDFNASQYIEKLINAGVKSFKIEGRLKDENYVKNVVSYYRNLIDKIAEKTSSGKIFSDFEPDVNKSFNRGFTSYFLNDREHCYNFDTPKSIGQQIGKITKIDKHFFETNTKLKLSAQDGLCYMIDNTMQGCLINKIDGNKIYPNKMDKLKLNTLVYRNLDYNFEKQLTTSKIKRRIGVKFNFENNVLSAIDEDKNEIKMDIKFSELPKNQEKMKETFINQLNKTGDSDFYVIDIKINGNLPFIVIAQINNIRRQILDKLTELRLANYKQDTQKKMQYVDYPIKNLDYKTNIHNLKAEAFYKNCNAIVCQKSYESTKPKNVELMRTKHCLKYAFNMCKSNKKLFLIDNKGKKYSLKFDCQNCEMAVIDIG